LNSKSETKTNVNSIELDHSAKNQLYFQMRNTSSNFGVKTKILSRKQMEKIPLNT